MTKTLHINQINSGIAKIKKLGHMEDTFEVLDHSITLRTVHRTEIEAANRYCKPMFEEAQESEDTYSLGNWLQAVKIETLSYAVMEIDDIDFHGIDFITTEEVDPETGTYVKVQKHAFVRELLLEWEDSVIDILFKKFQTLEDRAEERAREGVVFKEEDLRAKIEELEEELEDLREKQRLDEAVSDSQQEAQPGKANVDVDSIKSQVFGPESEAPQQTAPQIPQSNQTQAPPAERPEQKPQGQEDEGYYYANDRPDQESEAQKKPYERPSTPTEPLQEVPATAQNQTNPSEGQQVTYYNEDGEVLTDEELRIAKENERLLNQRQKSQEDAQALKNKRKPLNQVDARVRETKGQTGHPQEKPVVNANKKYEAQEFDESQVAHVEEEVLRPVNKPDVDWDDAELNKNPNVNPNFQPPHKRNK